MIVYQHLKHQHRYEGELFLYHKYELFILDVVCTHSSVTTLRRAIHSSNTVNTLVKYIGNASYTTRSHGSANDVSMTSKPGFSGVNFPIEMCS